MKLRRYLNILCFILLPILSMGVSLLQGPDSPLKKNSMNEIFDRLYPQTNTSRYHVPKTLKAWNVRVQGYHPPYIINPSVLGQPWADPENVGELMKKFNTLDGEDGREVDRRSVQLMKYAIEKETGRPLNPNGRTGVTGRGLLGRWGPNFSVHLIVTRWFRDQNDNKIAMPSSGKAMLQFVAVKFYGNYQLPGGFVEPGETYMNRAVEEFLEEAVNSSNMTKSEYRSIKQHLADLVSDGNFIYQGYIKDNRNTDNAWIEGAVINVHDTNGTEFIACHLSPGDGAEESKWLIAHSDMICNPTHKEYLKEVTNMHNAHW